MCPSRHTMQCRHADKKLWKRILVKSVLKFTPMDCNLLRCWFGPAAMGRKRKDGRSKSFESILATIEFNRKHREPRKRDLACVNCGRPAEQHTDNHGCHGYQTMNLPAGKTCADCRHVDRCCLLYAQLPEDQTCQFFPVRWNFEAGK